MLFPTIEFLFVFLPGTLLLYWVVPRRARNLVLLAASLLFYTWGSGALVVLLLVSTFVDYFAGWLVDWAHHNDRIGWRRVGVTLSVATNLALLSYFKYANFIVEQFNAVGARFGASEPIAWTSVVLPIGISFFTFQSMSYTIDVARGRARHLRNPLDFALYVALFPQLIAGPIVRFHEIADEIRSRKTEWTTFGEGIVRFGHGLAKKTLVADSVAVIVDSSFALSGDEVTTAAAWLGTLAYTIQIYFDFSGYSDMAIGLGLMFGFRFPENFRRPYSALSITDFWRRWHITLSNWFRDYLYIPLGGGRGSTAKVYRNLIIVFLLTGIWHGAQWTFVVWGIYHGMLLLLERATGQRPTEEATVVPLRRALVLLAVMMGWVMFRAVDLGQAAEFYRAMLVDFDWSIPAPVAATLTNKSMLTLLLSGLVFFLPGDLVFGRLAVSPGKAATVARIVLVGAAIPYALILVMSGSFSPFLYFQF